MLQSTELKRIKIEQGCLVVDLFTGFFKLNIVKAPIMAFFCNNIWLLTNLKIKVRIASYGF